jgi:hypothetical protein
VESHFNFDFHVLDTEYFFMYLLAVCISPFERWSFISFACFLWDYWLVGLFVLSSLCMLDINPQSDE